MQSVHWDRTHRWWMSSLLSRARSPSTPPPRLWWKWLRGIHHVIDGFWLIWSKSCFGSRSDVVHCDVRRHFSQWWPVMAAYWQVQHWDPIFRHRGDFARSLDTVKAMKNAGQNDVNYHCHSSEDIPSGNRHCRQISIDLFLFFGRI